MGAGIVRCCANISVIALVLRDCFAPVAAAEDDEFEKSAGNGMDRNAEGGEDGAGEVESKVVGVVEMCRDGVIVGEPFFKESD